MFTSINQFKKYLFESYSEISNIINDNILKNNGIILTNTHIPYGLEYEISINNELAGFIRLSKHNNWIVVEAVDLKDKFQRKGYGTIIYQAILDSAIKIGMKGLYSPTYDFSSGQQRSPKA